MNPAAPVIMKAFLRISAGLAIMASLPAAPSSDLGSEILLTRNGANGFALIDRSTGVLRSGTIQGGRIVWQARNRIISSRVKRHPAACRDCSRPDTPLYRL